jgi:hypothetical protein
LGVYVGLAIADLEHGVVVNGAGPLIVSFFFLAPNDAATSSPLFSSPVFLPDFPIVTVERKERRAGLPTSLAPEL